MNDQSCEPRDHGHSSESGAYIVGIGASAGGLEALERLFAAMPANTGMAFVVIQHLSPDFKSLTDELLARRTSIPIRQATDGIEVQPNAVYLLPPKKDMILSDGRLLLSDKDPTQSVALPIDRFFRSLAQDAGPRAIGIILSGTGSDGSRGIRDIHAAGGLVVAQSPESAKFDGMPNSAVNTGVVQFSLAPEEIPAALLRHIRHPLSETAPPPPEPPAPVGMDAIFRLLRDGYGIDFSHYKPETVARRTERRLAIAREADIDSYAARLASDPDELNHLYKDLLIGVTEFVRDPEAFALLESEILPPLIQRIGPDEEFRAWVAGCATGEEAYSIAISIQEVARALGRNVPIKVFATDVHRTSLDHAGAGFYSAANLAKLDASRLERYFQRRGDGYQVTSDLRRLVVFAQHNILKDAPFTKLDLITCRNLLIYFQPPAQKKVLTLFHFGLKTGGALFLGPSEGAGELSDEFDVADTRWKLFHKRRDVRLAPELRTPTPTGLPSLRPDSQTAGSPPTMPDALLIGDTLLAEYMPTSVLVNERREVVRAFSSANRFLHLRGGWFSADVLDLVDDELRMALAGALARAMKEMRPVTFKRLRVNTADGECVVNVTVKPFRNARASMTYALIQLDEIGGASPAAEAPREVNLGEASREQVGVLEAELRYTRENLQAMIEEMETSNEELQATNEELVASNEELQSTNEELHSVNEELYTVNAEYQKKISELTELTADMENLLTSTEVHTIFLDSSLCIRKFTPKIGETFNLLPQDVGRRIDNFTYSLDHPTLVEDVQRVLETATPLERQVRDRRGVWYLLRVLPYRSTSPVQGVVLTLIDIDRILKAESQARIVDRQLASILSNSPNWVFVKDTGGRYLLADDAFKRLVGCDPIGKTAFDLFPRETADAMMAQDRQVLVTGAESEMEIAIPQPDGVHTYWSVMFPIRDDQGRIAAIGGIRTDVTRLKKAEHQAQEAVRQRDRFLAMLSHELRNPLAAIRNAAQYISHTGSHSAEIAKWLAVIDRRTRHTTRLLDDLLDVSRFTNDKIEIRKSHIDLAATVGEALEEVRPAFDERGLHLVVETPDDPIPVFGDPTRLQQIQVNLLMNAAKYTPTGGHVTYSLTADDEGATIRVRDDGAGMTPEMLSRAFDLFVQADDTLDRSSGGLGVGLTLVRAIVELHGGRVTARSDGPGRGCEFTVSLPIARRGNPPPMAQPESWKRDGAGCRILIVEDDDDIRESLRQILDLKGHHVRAVGDADAALDALAQHHPEVVVIDIGIPGMNGYDLARAIRRRDLDQRRKLIAVTGYGREDDRRAAFDAGFDRHMTKPVNVDDLLAALQELLPAVDAEKKLKFVPADC